MIFNNLLRICTSALLCFFCLILGLVGSNSAHAQLYSNGVNSISGIRVGIRTSNPQASLHIKEAPGSQGMGLPGQTNFTYTPLLRLESSAPNGGSIQGGGNAKWDFRMDGGNVLSLWHQPSGGTSTQVLNLYGSRIEFKNKIMLGSNAQFDKSLTPDGSQGYHLSLGMREVSSGNWMGTGFAFHQSSNGDFHLVVNKTANTAIQGSSGLANLTKLTINSYKATFNVHQEISTRPSATGNNNYVDLQFTNAQSANSDKRMFVIRSIGEQHSSAPNTLEFWDPNNNGNAWFSMPVRIGGGFSDLSVLNSGYGLYVSNGIRATKVKVDGYTNWPDYVFEPEYKLLNLTEVEDYIEQNRHLPGVPSASSIEEDGIDLGEVNAVLLKKIEELTLYVIDLEKRLQQIEK